MQATTTPKLANGHPAFQAGLAAVIVATAIAVGATVGIGLAQGAITAPAPAPVVGDYEANGVRRTAPSSEYRDHALDGAAFRKAAPAPVIIDRAQDRGLSLSEAITLGLDGGAFRKAQSLQGALIGGTMLWVGTDPTSPADRAGTFLNDADARHGGAFDQMSTYNNLGRSDADGNSKKVGRAHR